MNARPPWTRNGSTDPGGVRGERTALGAFVAGILVTATLVLALDTSFTIGMQLMEPTRLAGPSTLTLAHVATVLPVVTMSTSHAEGGAQPMAEGSITFAAKGEAGAYITGSVSAADVRFHVVGEVSNAMYFPVVQWRFGGDMDPSGVARFNSSGLLANLQVNVIAPLVVSISDGSTGSATFRLVYQ
ncbi:MAG: hypothetical protein OEW11_04525 [Nitrospirota bacterium]|nr:hypothetical protein [Nitrospirota bacterium]